MNESTNPALSNKSFSRFITSEATDKMTVGGTLQKVGLSFIVLVLAAIWGWSLLPQFGVTIPVWGIWVGLGLAFIAGLVAAFKANFYTVMIYAVFEGVYLGLISRLFASFYDGIVTQAIILTGAVALGAFFLYAARIIKVTKKFASVVMIATVGVLVYILVELVLALIIPDFSSLVMSGPVGIGIAAVIVLIAALNLFLDFNTIESGAKSGLSKKAEWYAAFGLVVTLVWLYISILRLLVASRN